MPRQPIDAAFDRRFGRLVVVCDDGTLWALHVRRPVKQDWYDFRGARVGATPVSAILDAETEDHVYVICEDGSVWALDLDSGEVFQRERPVPGSKTALVE